MALSSDGNTALVGGHEDYGKTGAASVFTRSESKWTQQGSKLIGNGEVSEPKPKEGEAKFQANSAKAGRSPPTPTQR